MTLEEALALAWQGNAVAFLGSGFARGAKNIHSEDFKSADELRIKLNTASGGSMDGNLGDAAEAYRSKLGDFALIEELKSEFSAVSVGNHHRTVSIIPWRRVYTTNYDNVFEVAAKESSSLIVPITLKVDPFVARDDGLQYVHLNGAVDGVVHTDLDFRVARGYQDFIDRLGIKLNANQLNEFLKAIDFVEERIVNVEKSIGQNRYVRECAQAMIYVRKRCEQLLDKQKK